MGIPILPALLLAKKIFGIGAYKAASDYGFHRVYRRLLEGLKRSNVDKYDQNVVRSTLKSSIRFPTTAYKLLQSNQTLQFLYTYAENVVKRPGSLPGFMVTTAKQFESVAGTYFSRALKDLSKWKR
mmetsp:Transcript_120381/g.236620  ORF Transcript_120381/g.236620 Transcript_120381/m.236620 type:complete len:126 (-) Transcript_120381:13-390(-)